MIEGVKQKAMASEIMELLEKGRPLPSTTISLLIKESYWKTLNLLEQLEREGLIVRETKGKYQTFWLIPEKILQITKDNDENLKGENEEHFA